jgi:hypothetical protein
MTPSAPQVPIREARQALATFGSDGEPGFE